MSFVVIEGDNGTGKDTIADFLVRQGFETVTYLPEVKLQENTARKSTNKTDAFLKYNTFCSEYVVAHKERHTILIRYWISTLAAAYADNLMTYSEVIMLSDKLKLSLCKPDYVIRLWVDHGKRSDRVNKRKEKQPYLEDDISLLRSQKYEWISREILYRSGYRWKEFDNSNENIGRLLKNIERFVRDGEN